MTEDVYFLTWRVKSTGHCKSSWRSCVASSLIVWMSLPLEPIKIPCICACSGSNGMEEDTVLFLFASCKHITGNQVTYNSALLSTAQVLVYGELSCLPPLPNHILLQCIHHSYKEKPHPCPTHLLHNVGYFLVGVVTDPSPYDVLNKSKCRLICHLWYRVVPLPGFCSWDEILLGRDREREVHVISCQHTVVMRAKDALHLVKVTSLAPCLHSYCMSTPFLLYSGWHSWKHQSGFFLS